MNRLLILVVMMVLLVPVLTKAHELEVPELTGAVCRLDDGNLLVRSSNIGTIGVHTGRWADGVWLFNIDQAAGTVQEFTVPGDVQEVMLNWLNYDVWVPYFDSETTDAPLCNPSEAQLPSAVSVIIVDPDGVLPDGYPMELLSEGGTFWGDSPIWYNDIMDAIGFTVYGNVLEVFADGHAWLHSNNGDDIYVELMPDLDERTNQRAVRVIAFYPGGYPG